MVFRSDSSRVPSSVLGSHFSLRGVLHVLLWFCMPAGVLPILYCPVNKHVSTVCMHGAMHWTGIPYRVFLPYSRPYSLDIPRIGSRSTNLQILQNLQL